MTQEANAVAVIAAINATVSSGTIAYDIDEIPGRTGSGGTVNPGSTPSKYVEVTISRRAGVSVLRDSSPGMTGYRVTTRAVAKSVTDARNLRRLTGLALEDQMLTVSGALTSPVLFETEDIIAPDEGWFSGLTYWTYSI